MKNATMVYRPGSELIHGFMVDYQVIDADEVNDALADGWYLTPTEAGEAAAAKEADKAEAAKQKAEDAPATRDELEAKAKELGIKFDGRTTDKKLGEQIAEKLKA